MPDAKTAAVAETASPLLVSTTAPRVQRHGPSPERLGREKAALTWGEPLR